MDPVQLQQRLDTARAIARDAADRVRESPPGLVDAKHDAADLVTEVDRAVELQVRLALREHFPDDAVAGEELQDTSGTSGFTWLIDPIDGTTNFASGVPWCSVSIGGADRSGPLLGVVADPWRREILSAARGLGSWVDDRPVERPAHAELAGGVVFTEWLNHVPWLGMTETLAALAGDFATVRIMGSSALSLAATAVGRGCAFLNGSYSPVDTLGAIVIARESGLVVRDFAGSDPQVGRPFYAAWPQVAPRITELTAAADAAGATVDRKRG
ncbi:inositol monophosphatase family protein [Flexivirga aerilata]|nr:inositol monophosphatase [Flexivirga aerilata]